MANPPNDKEHTPLFTRFLRPRPYALLVVLGVFFVFLNLYYCAFIKQSTLDTLNGVLILIIFIPGALLLRYEADRLLVKRVNEVFSEDRSRAKDLFGSAKDFTAFAKKSREIVRSGREYYLIVAFLILLLTAHPTIHAIAGGKINEILRNALTFESVFQLYVGIYWGILVGTFSASMVYSVIGFIAVMFSLNREKAKLRISNSIEEFRKALTLLRAKGKAEIDFDLVDLSFGELKDDMTPFQKLGYDLAVGCAVIGLAYSTPGIIYFLITHDLSNMIYYGFIVFVAALSLGVFIATEFGVKRVWANSKSEALSVLEQLCDRVKVRCVKSICKLESYESREDSAKDVAFVRSAISDLKEIKTSDLTSKTIAQIATTVVLPYIPLVLKVLGLY
jgi:hypothetical protein